MVLHRFCRLAAPSCALLITALVYASGCREFAGYAEGQRDSATRPPPTLDGPRDESGVVITPDHGGQPPPPELTLSCTKVPVTQSDPPRGIWADDEQGPFVVTRNALYEAKDSSYQPMPFTDGGGWPLDASPRAIDGLQGALVVGGVASSKAALAYVNLEAPTVKLLQTKFDSPSFVDVALARSTDGKYLNAAAIHGRLRHTIRNINKTSVETTAEFVGTQEQGALTHYMLRAPGGAYALGYLGESPTAAKGGFLRIPRTLSSGWMNMAIGSPAPDALLGGWVDSKGLIAVGRPGHIVHIAFKPLGQDVTTVTRLQHVTNGALQLAWGDDEGTYYVASEDQLWVNKDSSWRSVGFDGGKLATHTFVDLIGSEARSKLWILVSQGSPATGAEVLSCELL